MTISSLTSISSNLSINDPPQTQNNEINISQIQNLDSSSETITDPAAQGKKLNVIKKSLLALLFLSAAIFIAGIAIFLISPVLAPVMALVLLVSGVLFSSSVISFLISYRSENKTQKTQDAPKQERGPSPPPDDSQWVRMPIIQPESTDSISEQEIAPPPVPDDMQSEEIPIIQPETSFPKESAEIDPQKKEAARIILSALKSRNEALKNKEPNEYGIIKANSDYFIFDERKDKIIENPHDLFIKKISYDKDLSFEKINEIRPERYYHYDKPNNRLRFIGVEPNLEKIKLKRDVILLNNEKEELKGTIKTPLYHNQRHIVLERNQEVDIDDTEKEYYRKKQKLTAINQNQFFTNKLSAYRSILPAYTLDENRYLGVFGGKELDKVPQAIKPESFQPLLADLKKLRAKNIYIPDIKHNNLMCKKINGKDRIFLIDVDEANLEPTSPELPINLNYPAFFISEHLAKETGKEDYYYMQNFVMLQMMYLADTKQSDEDTLTKNFKLLEKILEYNDPDDETHQKMQDLIYQTSQHLQFSQAYLSGFNNWVDTHVLPAFRLNVKLAMADPYHHKLTYDLIDVFDFNKLNQTEEAAISEEITEGITTVL